MLSSKGVGRNYEKALYPSSSDAKMLKATAGAREMAQAVFATRARGPEFAPQLTWKRTRHVWICV